jgi:hypothetical protein
MHDIHQKRHDGYSSIGRRTDIDCMPLDVLWRGCEIIRQKSLPSNLNAEVALVVRAVVSKKNATLLRAAVMPGTTPYPASRYSD